MTNRTESSSNGDGTDDIFAGIPVESTPLTDFAARARAAVDPTNLAGLAPDLLAHLRNVPGGDERLERAIAIATGIVVDAVATDDEVVPGQNLTVAVSVFNGGPFEVALGSATIAAPDGWVVEGETLPSDPVQPGALATLDFSLTVSPDAAPTQPYFLERPRIGSMYDWSATPPALRGLPFQPPLLAAHVTVSVMDTPVRVAREATFRARNQAAGEVRREVRVVPLVDVKLEPESVIWPVDGPSARDFTVTLRYNGLERYGGDVLLQIDGWPTPDPLRFDFEDPGESQRFAYSVSRPAAVRDARIDVRALVQGDDRQPFDRGIEVVSYPHVRTTAWVRAARSTVRVAPIVSPPVNRVGYVRGAADRVPEALSQIGVPIEILSHDQLARGDLSQYDVIVVGSRAYETDSALTAHNDRLLAYTRDGGLLIVQYQQYQFVRGEYAPYALAIGRPHDRVTDENAPVRILQPDNSAFNAPNRIQSEDWEGWPQERGLYFARTWDDAYRPLLESNDPGGPPLQGGLLVARYGAGTYVYTGLSFFRALPAGTPGAFRLFLNLLGLRPDHVP